MLGPGGGRPAWEGARRCGHFGGLGEQRGAEGVRRLSQQSSTWNK